MGKLEWSMPSNHQSCQYERKLLSDELNIYDYVPTKFRSLIHTKPNHIAHIGICYDIKNNQTFTS